MGKDGKPEFEDYGKVADLLRNEQRRCNSFKIPQRSCIMARRCRPRESRRLEASSTQTCEPWVPSTCVSKLTSKGCKCSETLNPEKGALNDGYNLLSEYKDVEGSEPAGRADTGSETDPIRRKIVTSGQSRDQSVPFDEKPSIGTQERSKTVKKKSSAISRANKPPSNPTKTGEKINKLLKEGIKLEKANPEDTSKPIKTEDKITKKSLIHTQYFLDNNSHQTEKKHIVKDKKSTSKTDKKTGASQSSKSNSNDYDGSSYSATPRKKKSPHIAKLKSEKILEKVAKKPAVSEKENVGSNDDDLMVAITNEKSTTSRMPSDEDSQSCRRNIPRSSVMTIWHWLRKRSCYAHSTPTKELPKFEDPFLSLFFPAMVASDLSTSRMIRDESKPRKLRE